MRPLITTIKPYGIREKGDDMISFLKKTGLCALTCVALHAVADDGGRAIYEKGLRAYETDPSAAVSLFVSAVAEGSVEAMMAAAHCCEEGRGVPENYAFAIMWRSNAVEKDPVKACVGMAQMDSLWHGVREDDLAERRARFERHATDVDAAFAYVNQLLNDGKQAEAEDMLERAIVKFPPDARLFFTRGVMCRSRWDKFSAEIYFKGVMALEPDSYRANAGTATIKLDGIRYSTSVDASIEKAVKDHPEDIFLRWLHALHCRTSLNNPGGVPSYKWILERWNPGPVMVHHTYANDLSEKLGRNEIALIHREIAIKQAERSWTCQGMANTLFKLYRFEEAELYYARAAELDENDFKHLYQWGQCLARLEKFKEAESLFRMAREIKPSERLLRYDLAKCLVERGQYDEAFHIYTELEAEGSDGDVLLGLATMYGHGLGIEKDEKKSDKYLTRFHNSYTPKDKTMVIPRPAGRIRRSTAMRAAAQGEVYYYGRVGRSMNYATAADNFLLAVNKGADIGACGLVQVYAVGGPSLERNTAVALEWFDWLEISEPKDYLRSPAATEVVRIRMGCYGNDFADSTEAVKIARAVYELDESSANGVLLARALAFDAQLPSAVALMSELVARAEKNGHIRGLAEKRRMLALYEAGEAEKTLLEPPPLNVGTNAATAKLPADLNKPKPSPKKISKKPKPYPPGEQGLIDKANDYSIGKNALEKNYVKALECFTKAYEMNGEKRARAARGIAWLYQRGDPGVEKNYEMAEMWYLRAFEAGDERALMLCMRLYFSLKERKASDSEKALEYAGIISTSDKVNGAAHWMSAMAYAEVSRFDEAVKALERALVLLEQEKRGYVSDEFKKRLRDDLECYKRGELPPLEDKQGAGQ